MDNLSKKEKKIVIGVSGGVACYKAIEVIRELQNKGYSNIETILTENASKFVSPITFEAISGNVPYVDTFENERALSHIKVVENADVFLIVPATANTIAKLSTGIADNFLTTAYLASTSKVILAPSMNEHMYLSKANLRNIKRLKEDGVIVIEPEDGYLACGMVGKGRLAKVKDIVELTEFYAFRKKERILSGYKILITSGGTEEEIDPVRTITNKSTGKMGLALAETCSLLGAEVEIISGNCQVEYPVYCKTTFVKSAAEMKDEVFKKADNFHGVIMAAAVSDFSPSKTSPIKIKKTEDSDNMILNFHKTEDILKNLGFKYGDTKVIVGFAAETDNIVENAIKKVESKNVSFILANQVGVKDSGFGTDNSNCFIVERNRKVKELGNISKYEIAFEIAKKIGGLLTK